MERFLHGFGKLAGEEKKLKNEPPLEPLFEELIESQTAGSPMNEKVRWTNLKDGEIVRLFEQKGVSITRFIAKQLTTLKGLAKRRMKKTKTAKEVENRDGQFRRINDLKADFLRRGLPVLSIDTKKKEFIGQFYRAGKAYCEAAMEVFDHDFPSLAEGRVVPHGIYDIKFNKGYLSIGSSKDTSEFLCDNVKYHWQNNISQDYREATEMLLLMDGGGSNSCLHYIARGRFTKIGDDLENENQSGTLSTLLFKIQPNRTSAFSAFTKKLGSSRVCQL